MSTHPPGWCALVRKLYAVLENDEWRQFCAFCRQIKGRFDGDDFSLLSEAELDTLSAWATRARQAGV